MGHSLSYGPCARAPRWVCVVTLWGALWGSPARAAPVSREVPPRASAARPRVTARPSPPDVRGGAPYDGRRPRRRATDPLRTLPRVLLFLPRAASALLMNTGVALVSWWETSGVGSFVDRICFPLGGRLVLLPTVLWEQGLTAEAGASLTTDLVFGRRQRAALHLEGGAGHRQVWHIALRVHPFGLPADTPDPARGDQTTTDDYRWPRARGPSPGSLSLDAQFNKRDDAPYYGLGYHQPAGNATVPLAARMTTEIMEAGVWARVRLWRSFHLAFRLGADWRRLSDGRDGLSDRPLATVYGTDHAGWNRGMGAFVTGASLGVGGAVGEPLPKPGIRVRARALLYFGDAALRRHVAYQGDLEGFVRLGSPFRRLGFRARLAGVYGLDSPNVPLLYLPTLGGETTMRGFRTGRFRGETAVHVAAEYHFALHARLWLGLFFEVGGAFRQAFSKASLSGMDLDGGAMLALRIAAFSWLRLQVAGSRDGAALTLRWGGAP